MGALWAAAGCLQLQPFMFTRAFAEDVLGTAALSQPPPLRWAIRTSESVVGANPAAWNWSFALAELAIGCGLIALRRGRLLQVACWASVGFGLGVWIIGEGAGGLLTGTAALSTGAPGAALLYAGLTAIGWPSARPVGAVPVRALWAAVWTSGAALVFVPAQWGAHGLAAQAAMGWMMSPHWSAGAAYALTRALRTMAAPTADAICLVTALTYSVIGLCPYRQRASAVLGAMIAVAWWVFGQGFGGLSTGTATDVGAGPALVLLAAVVYCVSRTSARGEPVRTRGRGEEHEANRVSRAGVPRNRPARVV